MKRYWPIMGAASLAATIGSYLYVSRDPLYKEPETEEFPEEEIEFEAELPEGTSEMPVPHTTKKVKKEKIQTKRKQNFQKHHKKETNPSINPYLPSLPKLSGLEDTVEEEERPSYDLPPEERDKLNTIDLFNDYFGKALYENDFRVAETYLHDFNKRAGLNLKDDAVCTALIAITLDYNQYLSAVIKNCESQEYDSVFRKIIWGNLFLTNYEVKMNECGITINTEQGKRNPSILIQKGNRALEAIEYCRP